MKTRWLKSVIALVLAVAMMCGCAAGTGSDKTTEAPNETKAPSTEKETEEPTEPPVEEITLKYLMSGPAGQEDQQMVFDEFNKRLQEYIPGLTVDFEIVTASEYAQRIQLMQAGGEKLDIFTTYKLNFAEQVENGALMELDALIDEYAQGTVAAYPEYMWQYAKQDGKTYIIPGYQQLTTPYAFRVNKELADEYLDMEQFTQVLQSGDYVGFYDIIEQFCADLKADGKLGMGVYQIYDLPYHMFEQVHNYMFRVRPDGNGGYDVEYYYTMPEAVETWERMKEWYEAGYIREDILTATDHASYVVGTEGGYVITKNQYNPNNVAKWTDAYLIPLDDEIMVPASNGAGGVAISSTCEHPEAAMKLLDLLHTDKEMFNLLTYGIEGVHYLKMDETHINVPYSSNQGGASDKYGLYKWIVGNTEISYDTQYDSAEMREFAFVTVNQSDWVSDFISFKVDTSNISDDLANLTSVTTTYNKMLQAGVYDQTTDELMAEFEAQLKAANLEGILAEIQSQVDAWMANK